MAIKVSLFCIIILFLLQIFKMNKIITLILFLSCTFFLQAQDSTKVRSIDLNQGLNRIILKDEFRSPYVYRGINTQIVVDAELSSLKTKHQFSSIFIFGTIKTKFSPLASNSIFSVNYNFLKPVLIRERISLFAGPQCALSSWRSVYFPEMEAPVYSKVQSYYLGISAGVAAQGNYNFNNAHSLEFAFSVPLLNYIQRPHFLNKEKIPNKVILNQWAPQFRVTYERKISTRFSFLINYHYSYLYYAHPKPLRMLTNSLSAGLKYNFYKRKSKTID